MSNPPVKESLTTHTPGPWTIPHFALSDDYWDEHRKKFGVEGRKTKRRCDCKYVLCEHYMGAIATVHVAEGENEGDDPPVEEAKANARLIAASPTMFDYIKKQAQKGCQDAKSIIASIDS